MHASFMPLDFAFPGLLELVILVAVCCFLLGTWRLKVVFNHVRWFLWRKIRIAKFACERN